MNRRRPEGLFEIPPEWLIPPPRQGQRTDGAYLMPFRSKVRALCHVCVLDIHRYGVAVAPLPRVARWRLVGRRGSTLLCDLHRRDREGN